MIHVVLYEPEIPANTGNIIRTCMASGSRLHLIEPLGFSFDDKYLRRSGMDYIRQADIHIHPNWQAFLETNPNADLYFMTRYGKKAPTQFDFSDPNHDYYLVLGKESTGIDKAILKDHLERCMRLPMKADARSLNLSNCAAILVYEALRQQNYPGLSTTEEIKGEDFLENWNPGDSIQG
ncbi:MAG: tRNA (cytidine(34)-2'-O)-methyltransferase [Allobaculum sp.]|nr:tRNA (cytidine(34)-2'-O)-methyltransferase [Allobaculum sp.]